MAGGLDFWVPGSKAPDVLVWRRLGLETQERGSLAPQKEGSWDFALLSFGGERGGWGGWGEYGIKAGHINTLSHLKSSEISQPTQIDQWEPNHGHKFSLLVEATLY